MNNYNYTTYPREFITYRWYKPIITLILGFIFYIIFGVIIIIAAGMFYGGNQGLLDNISSFNVGYDDLDVYTGPGAVANMGGIACLIPALMLANRITRARPFSSFSSCKGGFRFNVLGKSLILALIASIPVLLSYVVDGQKMDPKFTMVGFIFVTILCPLQCLAEEYVFRGLIMQAVGSWFRSAAVALISQVVLFAALHPYNIYGVIGVACSGLTFGILAWYTNGIEAGGALHVVNNLIAFYFAGFGFAQVKTDTSPADMCLAIVFNALYIILVIVVQKKTHLYDYVKKDDLSAYNEKYAARYAKKTAEE